MSKNVLSLDELTVIFDNALEIANKEAVKYFESIGSKDVGACGFAWVELHGYKGKKLDGRMTITKNLKSLDFIDNDLHIWNPSKLPVQAIDVKEKGAAACVAYLREHGFDCYMNSRLD